ncbi:MAG TPA: NHLP bacteriocin export ABC transporter permease/ATPase subunit [Kineosporiaceae bacterium]
MTYPSARTTGLDQAPWLGHLGETVPSDLRTIPLATSGVSTLWLVAKGSFDLFAVRADGEGRWHPLGTIGAGAIVCSPLPGPHHTLLARPHEGGELRSIRTDLVIGTQRGRWQADRDGKELSSAERLLADGVDRGLTPLLGFLSSDLPPRDAIWLEPGRELSLAAGDNARPADSLTWIHVLEGHVRVGGSACAWQRYGAGRGNWAILSEQGWITTESAARVRVDTTAGRLSRGDLWDALDQTQTWLLSGVDRAVEQREQAYDERITLSRQAAQSARDTADRALRAVIQPSLNSLAALTARDEDAVVAACKLVAGELGITVADPGPGDVPGRVGRIERVALRSRFRARIIRLKGTWWRTNIGPLVTYVGEELAPIALRWRSGRYQATNPATGEQTWLTAGVAAQLQPYAVMFYPPLPEEPVPTWRLLLFGLRGSAADLQMMGLCALVTTALGLLTPIATGEVLGRFVPQGDAGMIVQVCLGLVAANLTTAAFLWLQALALLRLEGRFESTLQSAIWDRLLRLPATFFSRFSTGDLATAALGIRNIQYLLAGTVSVVVQAGILAVASMGLLFFYSVPLAFLDLGFLALSSLVYAALAVRQMKWQTKWITIRAGLNNKVFQTLNGLPKLRVAAAEGRAYASWAADFVQGKDYQKRIAWYANLVTAFNAGYVPLCMLGFYLVVAGPAAGTLSTAQFLSCSTAFATMLASVMQITNSISSLVAVVPTFRRLEPVLTEPLEVSEANEMPGELTGQIEVSHLSFGYSPDAPPVLNDVSFRISPGEFVAVVGPSGCGKSTLLRLLLGFEKPTNGTVLYDGQDLASLDISAVRRQCGVVLQNTKVSTGTIFQAICGAQNFTMDEAWAAADLAGLRADIEDMPMGMHTLLGESSTLSGGQRQRLVIAQALIRRPRILFFDEATSALDNESQRIITCSTQQLQASRIVIAHRLSTVMDADKVIVLSEGRVAECGPPAELLRNPAGLFYHLVRRQMTHTSPEASPQPEMS